MTINDINKLLAELAENPSRENVLDFAFALLQWMQIEPNAQNKVQLISPQTQKLKDYLAPAPQTVQPQLYRLSADNQNIRVRFAVLKKLKKETISQLVDNDPGLTSYQASVKGIVHIPGKPRYIPQQPYFIHFATTPDYDKLVLIFNQGEQKRIVSFRRRLTSTQYNKIIQQWQGVGTKSKPEIADLLWKSLDIKEVNKEFYKQIKERFDALLGIVKTQHTEISSGTGTTATDNQVKQFTVRLIGRYIFCWFLKEKGIIPNSLISKEVIQNTENYYQNILLKLFFETLNTKVQDRNPLTLNKLFEKIPYLNGGLFDESEEDKLFTRLDLDAWLLPFVEILESYDFTVDESSSRYQQVAVDPEMLGRIFENLLASQNEETEKLANNQRKAYGAFYTPREIVDYMVNESIKAYLQTQWEQHIINEKSKQQNNPQPTENLFGEKETRQLSLELKRYELKPEEKTKIEKNIEPLFAANPDAAHLKKDEKNLLLQFLEQIKILDPACGSGAFPMGILHKLVELHETLGTVKSSYELKKDILSGNIYGVDIMPMAIEIARLRAWLSLVLEENYNPKDPVHNFGVKPLPNLDFKFVCANSLVDLGLDAFIQESKGTLHEGFTQKLVNQLKQLENLRKQFFTPALASTEKEKLKTDYFEQRDKVIADIEAAHDPVLKQIAQKIKHWNPFDDSQASPFFSPTWMFGIDKGFDVVIGNPPYGVTFTKEQKGFYRKLFPESQFKIDSYSLFILKTMNLLRDSGSCYYIIPNTILDNYFEEKVREKLLMKNTILEIIDLSDNVFSDAVVHSLILGFQKLQQPDYTIKVKNTNSLYAIQKLIPKSYFLQQEKSQFAIRNFEFEKILSKLLSNSEYLETIVDIKDGIDTGDNKKFISATRIDNSWKPLIGGKDIDKYSINSNKYILHGNHLANPRKAEVFEQDKIVIRETGNKIIAAYDDKHFYALSTLYSLNLINKSYSLKYILALLNSSVFHFLMNLIAFEKTKGTFTKTRIFHYYKLPVKNINNKKQQPFISRVEKILSLKKKNQDTTALEKEIDVLVYKLYELSYDEVKIIDKDFWLSEAEYEKYKLEKAKE